MIAGTQQLSRRTTLAAGAAAVLSGCAVRRDPRVIRVAYSPITLRYIYEALSRAFEDAHPGLKIELYPAVDYDEILERDVRLSLVGDELDVSHAGIETLRFYIERSLATPLDDFLKQDKKARIAGYETIGRKGGVTYAIPFALSVPVLYYNENLLRRVGFNPDVFPGSWDAILTAASRISKLPPPISGIYYDASVDYDWQALVFSRGGSMMDPDEKRVTFAGPEGLWSLELLQSIGKAGQVDMSVSNARVALSNGLLGFYQNTSSNIRKFVAQAGGIPLGMTVLPVAPGGTLPGAGNVALIPARKAERQALAWSYVRFACGPIGQSIMAGLSGYQSLNPHAWDAISRVVRGDPLYAKAHEALSVVRPWYAFPGPNSGRIAQTICTTARLAILGRTTPQVALDHMRARVEALLAA